MQRRGPLGKIRSLRLKQIDEGSVTRTPAFAVAAAGRLNCGVQARFLAVDDRKINVHPRFDQAGRDHAAGEMLLEPIPDFGERLSPVGRGHQRREVIVSLAGQPHKQRLRLQLGVDDAERLLVLLDALDQFCVGQLPQV